VELCCDEVVSSGMYWKEERMEVDDEQGESGSGCTAGSKRPITSS
jgi:hypothetical protein